MWNLHSAISRVVQGNITMCWRNNGKDIAVTCSEPRSEGLVSTRGVVGQHYTWRCLLAASLVTDRALHTTATACSFVTQQRLTFSRTEGHAWGQGAGPCRAWLTQRLARTQFSLEPSLKWESNIWSWVLRDYNQRVMCTAKRRTVLSSERAPYMENQVHDRLKNM
jgi:hypothetical protein